MRSLFDTVIICFWFDWLSVKKSDSQQGKGLTTDKTLYNSGFLNYCTCMTCSFPIKSHACQWSFFNTPFHQTQIQILSNLRSHCFCLCPAISAFALAALVLPGSYPDYLDLIHSLSIGPYLIGLAKFGIAFPVSYHTYNGIRHLVRPTDVYIDITNVCLVLMLERIWYSFGSLSPLTCLTWRLDSSA